MYIKANPNPSDVVDYIRMVQRPMPHQQLFATTDKAMYRFADGGADPTMHQTIGALPFGLTPSHLAAFGGGAWTGFNVAKSGLGTVLLFGLAAYGSAQLWKIYGPK